MSAAALKASRDFKSKSILVRLLLHKSKHETWANEGDNVLFDID